MEHSFCTPPLKCSCYINHPDRQNLIWLFNIYPCAFLPKGGVYSLCVLFLCQELFLLCHVSTCCAIFCVSMKTANACSQACWMIEGCWQKLTIISYYMTWTWTKYCRKRQILFFDNNSSSSAVGAEMHFSRQNNRFEGQFKERQWKTKRSVLGTSKTDSGRECRSRSTPWEREDYQERAT